MRPVAIALSVLCLPAAAAAHDSGAVYLRLHAEDATLRGALDLDLGDALALLGRSPGLPEAEAWEAVAAGEAELLALLERAVTVSDVAGACPLAFPPPAMTRADDPGWLQLRFAARCPGALAQPRVDYAWLFDLDPSHRAYVALHHPGGAQSAVLTAAAPGARFDLRPPSARALVATFFETGVRQLATDADTLLFLVALWLPAPLARGDGRRTPRARAGEGIREAAAVWAAFAATSALALAVAASGVAPLPARGVEVAIALCVGFAALHNLRPSRVPPWRLAGLGVFFGLGSASQLAHLGWPDPGRPAALLGFQLGMGVALLAVAAVILPPLLSARRHPLYRRAVVELPSAAIAWLAAVWLVERALGVRLLG